MHMRNRPRLRNDRLSKLGHQATSSGASSNDYQRGGVETAILCADTGALLGRGGGNVDKLVHCAILLSQKESHTCGLGGSVYTSESGTRMRVAVEAIEVSVPAGQGTVQLPASLSDILHII
jgi:gamma-glutamyltranspeptidase